RLHRGVDRGGHQVLQHLHVVGVHGLGLDGDGQHLMLAVHLDRDHLAGGAGGVLGLLQLSLLGLHIALHLLGLTHQAVHIGTAVAAGHSCFHCNSSSMESMGTAVPVYERRRTAPSSMVMSSPKASSLCRDSS